MNKTHFLTNGTIAGLRGYGGGGDDFKRYRATMAATFMSYESAFFAIVMARAGRAGPRMARSPAPHKLRSRAGARTTPQRWGWTAAQFLT